MQCHYCESEAVFAADHQGIKVGLCEEHFREQLNALADADGIQALRDRVDIDRTE